MAETSNRPIVDIHRQQFDAGQLRFKRLCSEVVGQRDGAEGAHLRRVHDGLAAGLLVFLSLATCADDPHHVQI